MWAVLFLWSSPSFLQQGQHSFTCRSHFYRGKEALTVPATLTGFGGSLLLQEVCIFQSWVHLAPQHSSGSKQWPHCIVWDLNPREKRLEQSGQTLKSPHFCQASPVMIPAKHSHELHIMVRSCYIVQQPKIGTGPEQQRSLLVMEEETVGRVKKRRISLFMWQSLSAFSVTNRETPAQIDFSTCFLNCHYLLEAHSCRWAVSFQCWLVADIATKHTHLWVEDITLTTVELPHLFYSNTLIFTSASFALHKYWNFPWWRAASTLLLLFNNVNIQGTS